MAVEGTVLIQELQVCQKLVMESTRKDAVVVVQGVFKSSVLVLPPPEGMVLMGVSSYKSFIIDGIYSYSYLFFEYASVFFDLVGPLPPLESIKAVDAVFGYSGKILLGSFGRHSLM
jgi:hypothetical protein